MLQAEIKVNLKMLRRVLKAKAITSFTLHQKVRKDLKLLKVNQYLKYKTSIKKCLKNQILIKP
jgi:hypothetical protein